MIPPHLLGNRNPPQIDRQTDRDWGRERASLSSLPFAPTQKESQTLAMQPHPHPTHSSVCGTPLFKGWPKGGFLSLFFPLVCSWQLRALFLPSASSSFTPRPLSPTRTFSVLSGPPCPRASGEAATLESSLLPARAWPAPLCPVCGTHTAAPVSLRSGAERCRLIRGGVVYGG